MAPHAAEQSILQHIFQALCFVDKSSSTSHCCLIQSNFGSPQTFLAQIYNDLFVSNPTITQLESYCVSMGMQPLELKSCSDTMLAIGLLQQNIDCFSFKSGNKLALKNKTGKWIKGSALCVLFVGSIKHFRQWKSNFSLDLVPLTRDVMVNAKFIIDKFSKGEDFPASIDLFQIVACRWHDQQMYRAGLCSYECLHGQS